MGPYLLTSGCGLPHCTTLSPLGKPMTGQRKRRGLYLLKAPEREMTILRDSVNVWCQRGHPHAFQGKDPSVIGGVSLMLTLVSVVSHLGHSRQTGQDKAYNHLRAGLKFTKAARGCRWLYLPAQRVWGMGPLLSWGLASPPFFSPKWI